MCYFPNMEKAQIIDRIEHQADSIRALGATALFLYGSRTRNDSRNDSDLDVFVDFERGSGFSLMELAGIKSLLEEETGLEVHITTRGSLHPKIKADIERQAIRVL